MKLKIVTPERVVLDTDTEAVYAAAVDGEVGILTRHVPMVTPLKIGVLRYTDGGNKKPATVMGGLLSTDGETVTILTDAAELGTEIDRLRAEQAKARAEAALKAKADAADHAEAERALARATVRLKASSMH